MKEEEEETNRKHFFSILTDLSSEGGTESSTRRDSRSNWNGVQLSARHITRGMN